MISLMDIRHKIALGTAVVLCCPANSQNAPPRPPTEAARVDFSTLDRDLNSVITKDETLAVADLEGVFDTLDGDRDGKISPSEFSRWSRAGKSAPLPRDPATAPTGSAGAQHMPRSD